MDSVMLTSLEFLCYSVYHKFCIIW